MPVNTDHTETLRSLMVSQGSAHQRMLDELNRSITELATRREALESEFAQREAARIEKHEATRRQLDDERQALERQSYMATRRKLGQGIHKIMTGPNGGRDQNQNRRSGIAILVFLAYIALGISGGVSTYLSFLSFDSSLVGTTPLLPNNLAINPGTGGGNGSIVANGGVLGQNQIGVMSAIPMYSYTLGAMDSFKWFLIVKLVLSSIITVFGFVSAAAWMRKHLDTETRLSEEKLAFIADIERASWVIEAIHEVKNEAQGQLPKEWVDAVTRNLFASRTSAGDLDDGAQALRALIGLAGSAKIGPQGLEMEFNKKGTKALGQE